MQQLVNNHELVASLKTYCKDTKKHGQQQKNKINKIKFKLLYLFTFMYLLENGIWAVTVTLSASDAISTLFARLLSFLSTLVRRRKKLSLRTKSEKNKQNKQK